MKKSTFFLAAFLVFSGIVSAQTSGAKISKADSNWLKQGIYGGYQPSDEILTKRSSSTKHFMNADGTETAQIGELLHYQDQQGFWQDVDLSINKMNGTKGFSNESNNVKSYFPSTAGLQTVTMKVSPTISLSWWKNPKLKFTLNGTTLNIYSAQNTAGSAKGNSIVYPNVYPAISEEFETMKNGLENNTIISSMTTEMKSLPADAMVEFSQVVELAADWKINVNGKAVKGSFSAARFSISIPGLAEELAFSPIVIFDNSISKEEALYLTAIPASKLSASQKLKLQNHVLQVDYAAEFVDGGLRITSSVPASWLQKSGRTFPVTVDPTVTIGATGVGTFYGPLTHWYGFQRHADLYLQSELGFYGNITAIEYFKTGVQAARTKPTKVFLRSTAANILTGTDAWNSTTYIGGLTANFNGTTTQDASSGWKMITLTNSFSYSSGNLMVMVYDEYGGGGLAQYMAQTDVNVAGRQAFKRQDGTDPGDGTATAVENKLQTIRITYLSEVPTITSFSPATVCSNTGTVTITGTGLAGATSVTIGGIPVTSFVVNSTTQITAIAGAGSTGVVEVTNALGSSSSATELTVNLSPSVDPIAGGAMMICVGSDTPAFTNTTAGGTWSVVDGTGSATIDSNGVLTGVSEGSVTVKYIVSGATCDTEVTTTVNVTGLPPIITITPATASVCSGTVQELSASGMEVAGFATIGSDTTITTTTEELTSFCNRRINLYVEMIFTAAELNAVGITGGNINSMAFEITTLGSSPDNTNYTMQMGSTTMSTFAAQFITTGLTTVFGPSNYTHASGWNTLNFPTPYVWDGISNLVVLISHDGIDALYNAQTYYTQTTGNTVLYKYNQTGPLDAGGTASNRRFNTRFSYNYDLPVTWSPITNLYTDPEGTIPYASDFDLATVYTVPQVDIQYVATIENAVGCESSATVDITINTTIAAAPTGNSPQNFNSGDTIADLIVVGENLQWYLDAAGQSPIPPSTVLVGDTIYYVSQTPTGECESEVLAITAQENLGVSGFDKANFSYYPNPVNNILTLKYTQNITAVNVFNLLGQNVLTKNVNSNIGDIDISTLSSGTYLVRVISDNDVTTIKVIKE